MAHMIENMAYVGAVPWHGLGQKVEADITLEEFQKEAGLDWTVSKRSVMYSPGHTFRDKFVLARDSDDKAFSVVSGRYKPVQPKEIFEFFRDLLAMHNMKMHTAGSLSGGSRIWCLAETGDVHKVLGIDRVDSYLLLSTSYDLTLSTLAQFTSVRVVCNNTLHAALQSSEGRVTFPHIRDFNAKDIKDRLGIGRDNWEAFTNALDMLAKIKVDVGTAAAVMDKVFDISDNPEERMVDSDRIHAANVVEMFQTGRAKGADIAGPTAWGLLNATTEYIDWHKRARSQDSRLNGAWFGDGARIKQTAMNELLLLAA